MQFGGLVVVSFALTVPLPIERFLVQRDLELLGFLDEIRKKLVSSTTVKKSPLRSMVLGHGPDVRASVAVVLPDIGGMQR